MNFLARLEAQITKNDSLLAIGLDPVADKLPSHLKGGDATFEFNKAIIDATAELVCAFKPNTAFYEAYGDKGLTQLKKTCDYIRKLGLPLIIDAKRADIGNTNQGYADFAFDYLGADAITLHPYLGGEALEPFLARADKGCIILCKTSNPGAGEFQDLKVGGSQKLYEAVAQKVKGQWNTNNNCLLVVGATYPDELRRVRAIVGPDMTILVPGIGAQGGDLKAVLEAGLNPAGGGLIINSGRDIIYAGSGKDFPQSARSAAEKLRAEINKYRR